MLSAYLAAMVDYSDVLAPGERATLPIIPASLWQANKAYQYLDGIFTNVPAFRKLVAGQTSDTISLKTRVDIECRPASFRTVRGGTACAIIADEVAFWRSDTSANSGTGRNRSTTPLTPSDTRPWQIQNLAYRKFNSAYFLAE